MRVALDVSAVPTKPAGAGVYVLRLVEALAATGEVDLSLVARRGDGGRWPALAPGASVAAVAPSRRPLRLAWEQARGPVVARRTGAEVWHGPHYTLPLRSSVPAVVTVHDLTFFDHPDWHEAGKVRYFRRMIPAAANRARAVVAVSAHTARRLAQVVGPRAPVHVVPHGVDHDRFTPAPTEGDLERLALHGIRPPFVAFLGTIEPRKDVPGLVRAVSRLVPTHPDLQLVLAGRPGWGADAVDRALALAPALDRRVVRTGYLDDTSATALLRHAAAVAYPSLEEGFGLPVLEALACGAAVVTTTGSAMEEVAAGAALLAAPGDDAALAEALQALLDGSPEAGRCRRAGPPVAAAYTWAASAEGHLAAYRAAVA